MKRLRTIMVGDSDIPYGSPGENDLASHTGPLVTDDVLGGKLAIGFSIVL